MRRSTRKPRRTRSTATSSRSPKPVCDADGSFLLLRSNGQKIKGNCHDPDFRLSRLPICHTPDAWFADCNDDGPPHTLRIYRLGEDQTPKEVHLYAYVPKKRDWSITQPKLTTSGKKKNKTRFPTLSLRLFLTTPLSRFVALLRWLLGDTDKWHTLGKFVPSRDLVIGPSGELKFTEDPFMPLMIRYNGDIFIEGKRYSKTRKINVLNSNHRVWFYRKRGNYQKLYILKKNSKDELTPTVLQYQYGTWWVCERVGPGSLSDDRSLAGARAASFLYVLGLIYILFLLF